MNGKSERRRLSCGKSTWAWKALLQAGRSQRSGIGCLETLTPELAQHAGELLASTGRANAVDATVIASAALRGDMVVTSDPTGLRELAGHVKGVSVECLG